MKLSASKNFGFTLVELLVTIAIIGILSSVAVVNLGSARDKAKIAAMQETLASLRPVVSICFSDQQTLLGGETSDPCGVGIKPHPASILCTGASTSWPDLETQYDGWSYCDCESNVSAGTYRFGIIASGGEAATCSGATSIICTESTCSVSS